MSIDKLKATNLTREQECRHKFLHLEHSPATLPSHGNSMLSEGDRPLDHWALAQPDKGCGKLLS